MRPRRKQTDISLMHSLIRSAQLQSELHIALDNSVCGTRRNQTDTYLKRLFIRSAELQLELHTALINSVCGTRRNQQVPI